MISMKRIHTTYNERIVNNWQTIAIYQEIFLVGSYCYFIWNSFGKVINSLPIHIKQCRGLAIIKNRLSL